MSKIIRNSILIYGILAGAFHAVAQRFERLPGFAEVSVLEDVNGVSVADYDQDGDLDVYIVSFRRYVEDNPQSWSRLLRNDLENGFTDVTQESNLLVNNETIRKGALGDRYAGSWGDYDNDGYPDLFLSNNGGDELWHNLGDGTFEDVTISSGVQGCDYCFSTNGLWWDYDLDGDLDLYVSDWLLKNRQFENNGDGSFTDISTDSGLDDFGQSWAAQPIDVNDDGFPDLYVVNDFGANTLFVSNRNGTFTEKTAEYGLEDDGEGMGVDVCDYNNDGNFDIYVTNIYDRGPNPFFVGQNTPGFSDEAADLGIDDTGWGWATRFFDADHDMDEDLYVVNGFFLTGGIDNRNMFFLNEDDGFKNIAYRLGIDNIEQARGMEVFDYDLDGDQDIVIANRRAPMVFHKNLIMEQENSNTNWIQIILEGTTSNRDGYGSVVQINCDGSRYIRLHTGTNIFGQSLKPIHFGLADNEHIDRIEVTWPGGVIEAFYDFEANQIITIREGDGEVVKRRVLSVPDAQAKVKVYPNPFDQYLLLESSAGVPGPFTVTLRDLSGSIVTNQVMELTSNEKHHRVELNNLDLPAGCYIYSILGPGFTQSGKVYKAR